MSEQQFSKNKRLKQRYRLLKLLGQGSFGKTYLAVDEHQTEQSLCAIKQFYPISQNSDHIQKASQLFELEALRLEKLGKHPQIAQLLDRFQEDDYHYLVQEFIQGQSLSLLRETEPVYNENKISHLLLSLLPVLEFIHSHNIIHRDIKPANLIHHPNGQFILVDFGASKYASATAFLQTGTLIGTPEYVAPEQLRGKATFASDIYSLGVTCIYLLTHISPFELFDTSEDRWVWRHYLVNNPLSEKMGKVLDQMIEQATNRRYQFASEIWQDLTRKSIQVSLKQRPNFSASKLWRSPKPQYPFIPTPDQWKRPQTLTGHLGSISALAIASDGKTLISSSYDCTLKLWDLETGANLGTITGHRDAILALTTSQNGQVVSASVDGIVKLWYPNQAWKSKTLIAHQKAKVSIAVAFSPDGQMIATGSDDQTVKLWESQSQALVQTLTHPRGINAVAFSPDGEMLASGSSDNSVHLWNVKTGKHWGQLQGHLRDINALAFSPDGEIIASGSSDNTIKIWQVRTQELLHTLYGHSDWVRTLSLSWAISQPNHLILISGSADQTLKIWEVKTGRIIETLMAHNKDINTIAIANNGEMLVSGGSDNTIKIWRLQPTR